MAGKHSSTCSRSAARVEPHHGRRKFRSQTSDNMDRWKAEQGRGREKRKIRREKSGRERVRSKKMEMREKVGKSRFTVFFQWFVAPEGRKVGSLKRRVRSQLARGEMKNCTPLWREAHFQFVANFTSPYCGWFWGLENLTTKNTISTLWWCQQFAIENGPVEIVDFPMKHGGSFQFVLWTFTRG